MNRTLPVMKLCRFILSSRVGMVAALILLATVSVRSAQNSGQPKEGEVLSTPAAVNKDATLNTPKPAGATHKSNFEKTKDDAAQLSALADQLRDELKQMNANVFSLDVLQKTEQLEKLAKKIKGEANGR